MNPLLESFLQEARENLKFIEQNLEDLGSGDDELLNAIFRAAHTLKGGSGIVGFDGVRDITHKAEDLLDQLRAKKLSYQESMLDALYDAFDEVLNLVESAEGAGDVVEADSGVSGRIIEQLDLLMGNGAESNIDSFTLPDAFVTSSEAIYNFSKINFDKLKNGLESEVSIDNSNLNDQRAYAIFFDLDKSCMIFGNDPLYALSLLGDKVKNVVTDLGLDAAKGIIEGKGDEEGLELYLKITALVEASYEEIEDALFNFIDDIAIYAVKDCDVSVPASVEGQSEIDEKTDESAKVENINTEMLNVILDQQCEQLNYLGDQESTLRVKEIASICFEAAGKTFSPSSDKPEAILSAIGELVEVETPVVEASVKEKKQVDISAKKVEVTKPIQTVEKSVSKQKSVVENKKPQKEVKTVQKSESKESKKEVVGKVVKVEQSSIDQLMSVVGELLVAKNSLPYLAESVEGQESEVTKRAIMEKYSFIDRLTSQLQDLTMSMRMLPLSYVFDRYPKLVREISKKLGKKVKLVQEGGDTKLDKNMIEMLADPLIHIIRNSLDHGIESPATRKESGKAESGQITMKAYPESDRVMIEIIDDGKGIDSQMVVNKVLEKDLIDPSKLDTMSDNEKLNLIMLPGLSTAESISEYSGRGVGMDVVKKSIESFGGTIHLESSVGKGTKIVLSIPVSLAVTTLLHVSMNDMHYGFPMDSVSETVKISKESITILNNEYYIYLRGEIIPLVVIDEMMDMHALDTDSIALVVLDVQGSQVAVVVNDLLGQLSVVQKPMQGLLSDHSLIGGTALLGNGQIMMIIDPVSLWEVSDSLGSNAALETVVA
ncbi:MAG: chemotaxis protein CheA [Epsilonproteobacteria bacterium]|nr:chemotaxis protein CheA [Campylobacterota bacterium]